MDKNEITNLIKELIEKTHITPGEASVTIDDSKSLKNKNGLSESVWFSVEIKDPYLLLNREGEGLFALNHLARKIIEAKYFKDEENKDEKAGLEILIDINGFQKKKIEGIHTLAHMMAERARYFKSSIEIDPMPAFERRVVHEFLADARDLKTESEGVGPSRRVIIKYIGGI